MYADYNDIRSRIAESPTWFDQHGAPRYGTWAPAATDIHADDACLFEIACQGCDLRVLIGMDVHRAWHAATFGEYIRPTRADPGSYGFGDFPRRLGPNNGDCCVGVTMTTQVTRIVEFWVKEGSPGLREWVRHREFEFAYQQEEQDGGNDDTGTAGRDRGTRLDA